MPNRCVAGGCSSRSNLEKGLVLHAFPYFNDDRPEAKKRRRKWASFVCQKRAEWEPTKNSVLCSLHFKRSDYQRQFNMIDEETNRVWFIPRLVRDELGISAVPTVHAKSLTTTTSAGETSRSKRMSNAMQATTSDNLTTTCDQYQVSDDRENDCSISQIGFDQTEEYKNRQLRNQIITLRGKLKACKKEPKSFKRQRKIIKL